MDFPAPGLRCHKRESSRRVCQADKHDGQGKSPPSGGHADLPVAWEKAMRLAGEAGPFQRAWNFGPGDLNGGQGVTWLSFL